jgi:hypothetical protein
MATKRTSAGGKKSTAKRGAKPKPKAKRVTPKERVPDRKPGSPRRPPRIGAVTGIKSLMQIGAHTHELAFTRAVEMADDVFDGHLLYFAESRYGEKAEAGGVTIRQLCEDALEMDDDALRDEIPLLTASEASQFRSKLARLSDENQGRTLSDIYKGLGDDDDGD